MISQVYGGGGNSGSTYKNDFIELLNSGNTNVSLNGWSLQYASDIGTSWSKTDLTNITLSAGQYYLVQEAQGSGGTTNLPTPDATGTISMAATAGKVALVNNTTLLSGSCPNTSSILDLVGYGSTASCFEGSGRAPAPSAANSDSRKSSGCQDTNDNAADLTAGLANPRNTASATNPCTIGPLAPRPRDLQSSWFDVLNLLVAVRW